MYYEFSYAYTMKPNAQNYVRKWCKRKDVRRCVPYYELLRRSRRQNVYRTQCMRRASPLYGTYNKHLQ